MGSTSPSDSNQYETVAALATKTTWSQNKKCIAYCFILSLASLQYGLDLSVINSAQAMKGFLMIFGEVDPKGATGYSISTQFQQLITSMMNVGVIVGSFAIEPSANLLGRRRCFLTGCLACFIGATILIVSTNKGSVVFGRFCVGVSNALFLGLTTIYISEAAPAHLRGSLVSFQQLSVNIGTVIGTVVNNATKQMDSRLSYQIPLLTLYGVPILLLVLAFVMPESPRWLVLRGRDDDAKHHLRRLRSSKFPPDVLEAELHLIKDAATAERDTALDKWGAVRLMFSKAERTRTLLTFAALTFHPASGFPFLAGYSTYFFQIAGSSDAFIDSIIVTCVSLVGAIGGVYLNRWVGRRPVLMATFGLQSVLMLVIGITWTVIPGTKTAGKIVVAMCIIFQCNFSAGCGPVAFICAGELPSNHLRAVTYGLGSAIGFTFNFVISLTTPYFINPAALNIGPKIGYIWFASNLITLIFVFFFYPETHRRSLENIDEMFYSRVPLRNFKVYQCSDVVVRSDVKDVEEEPSALEVEGI